MKAVSDQLDFRYNMLSNTKFIADREVIRMRKQHDVDKNNSRDISVHVDYGCTVGEKFSILDKDIHRELNCPPRGLYIFLQVYTNGKVRVQRGDGLNKRIVYTIIG